MKRLLIKLNRSEDVKEFVNVINRYPVHADLRSGHYVVDAKSILGIFSLDFSKPIVLDIFGENCDDLITALQPFCLKEKQEICETNRAVPSMPQ